MIQLEHLTVVKQDTVILKDIDLSLQQGEKILLKGESGSGKRCFFLNNSAGVFYLTANPLTGKTSVTTGDNAVISGRPCQIFMIRSGIFSTFLLLSNPTKV